jgi:hypothetical protein
MAMPRELEILSRRAIDHIEQRPECLLLTLSGLSNALGQCPLLGEQAAIQCPLLILCGHSRQKFAATKMTVEAHFAGRKTLL